MATSLENVSYPDQINRSRFLSVLSEMPQDRMGFKHDQHDIVLTADFRFAKKHAILGNTGEAMRYLNNFRELLRSSSPYFTLAFGVWLFYIRSMTVIEPVPNPCLMKKVAQLCFEDLNKVLCSRPEGLASSRVGIRMIQIYLGWCLLAQDKLRSAVAIFDRVAAEPETGE